MRWKDGLWVILLLLLTLLAQLGRTQSTGAPCLLSTLDIPNAEFDDHNSTDVNDTSKVLIRCKSGFTSFGAQFVTCLNGNWEGSATCVTMCEQPKPPDVGALVNPKDKYVPGEKAKMSCPYRTFTVTCQEDKSWAGMNSRCFSFDVNITMMEVVDNGNITLPCASSKNNMKDRISWLHKSKKNGVIPVAEASVKYTVNSQGNLELSNLHLDDDGMFMCLVENSSNQVKGVTAYIVKIIAKQNERSLDRADSFILDMEQRDSSYFRNLQDKKKISNKLQTVKRKRKHSLPNVNQKTRDSFKYINFPPYSLQLDEEGFLKQPKKKNVKIVSIWGKGSRAMKVEGIPNDIQIGATDKDIKSTLDKAVNKADTSHLDIITKELNDLQVSTLKGQRFLQHSMTYLHKTKNPRSTNVAKIDKTVGALLIKLQNIAESTLQLKDKAKYLSEYDFTFKLLHVQLSDIYAVLNRIVHTAQILKRYTQNKQNQIEIEKLNEDFLVLNVGFNNVIRKLRAFGIDQLIQMGLSTNIFQRAIADITASIKIPLKQLFTVNLDIDRAIAERKHMDGKQLTPTLAKIYRSLKPLQKKVENMKPSLTVLFQTGTTQFLVTKEVCDIERTLKRGLDKFDEVNDYLSLQKSSIQKIRFKVNDLYAQLKTVWVRTTEITKKFVSWLDITLSIDYIKQDTNDALTSIDKSLQKLRYLTSDLQDIMQMPPTMQESNETKQKLNNDLFLISQPIFEANVQLETFSLYIGKMLVSNSSFSVVEDITKMIQDSLKYSLLTLKDIRLKDANKMADTTKLIASEQLYQMKNGISVIQNHLEIFSQLLTMFQNILNDALYLELSADVSFRTIKSIKSSIDKSIKHITTLRENALKTLSSNTLMDPVKLKPEMYRVQTRFSITLYKISSMKKILNGSCRKSGKNNAFMLHFDAIFVTAQNSLRSLVAIDREIKNAIMTETYMNVISVANSFRNVVRNFRTIDAHVDGLKTTITISAKEKVTEDMYKAYTETVVLDFKNGVTKLEYLLSQNKNQDYMVTIHWKIKAIMDEFNNGKTKLNVLIKKLSEDNAYLIGISLKTQIQLFYMIVSDGLASIQEFVNSHSIHDTKTSTIDLYWIYKKLPQIKDMLLFGVDMLKNMVFNTEFGTEEQIMENVIILEYDNLLSTIAKAKKVAKHLVDAAQKPSYIGFTTEQYEYIRIVNLLIQDASTRLSALGTAINIQQKLPVDFSSTHTLLLTFLNVTENLQTEKPDDKDLTSKRSPLEFIQLYQMLDQAISEIKFTTKTFSSWCQSRTTTSANRVIVNLLKNIISKNMKDVEEIQMTIPTPKIRNWYSKTFPKAISEISQKVNNTLRLVKTVGKFWSMKFRPTIGAHNETKLTNMVQFILLKGLGRLNELKKYTEETMIEMQPMDTQKLFDELNLFLVDMEVGLKSLKTMDKIIDFIIEYDIPFDAENFSFLITTAKYKLLNATSKMQKITSKFNEWPKTAQNEYKEKLGVQVDALFDEFEENENIIKILRNNIQVASGFDIFPDTMKQVEKLDKMYNIIRTILPLMKYIKEKIKLSQQTGERLNLKEISRDFKYSSTLITNATAELNMIAAHVKESIKQTQANIITTVRKDLYEIQESLPDEIQEWSLLWNITKPGQKLNNPLKNISASLNSVSNILKTRHNLLRKAMQHVAIGIKSEFGYDFSPFEEYITTLMQGVKSRQILTRRHAEFFSQEIERAKKAGENYELDFEMPVATEKSTDYNIPEEPSLPSSFVVDIEKVLQDSHQKSSLSYETELGFDLPARQINQPDTLSIDVDKILAEARPTVPSQHVLSSQFIPTVETNALPQFQQFTRPDEVLIIDVEKAIKDAKIKPPLLPTKNIQTHKFYESPAMFLDVEKTLKDASLEVPKLSSRIETGYVEDSQNSAASQAMNQASEFFIDVEKAFAEANLEIHVLQNKPIEIDVVKTLKQAKQKVSLLLDEMEAGPRYAYDLIKEWQETYEETQNENKLTTDLSEYMQKATHYAVPKQLNLVTRKLDNVAKRMAKVKQAIKTLSKKTKIHKSEGKSVNANQMTGAMLIVKQELGEVNSQIYELLNDVLLLRNISAGKLEVNDLAETLVLLQTHIRQSTTAAERILKLTSPHIPVLPSQDTLRLDKEFYELQSALDKATIDIKNVKNNLRKKQELTEIEVLEEMERVVNRISKLLNTTVHTLKQMQDNITLFSYDMTHYDETKDGKKDGTVRILTPASLIKMDIVKDSNDMFSIQINPLNITKGVVSAINLDERMTELTTQFKTSMLELGNLYSSVNVTVSSLPNSTLHRSKQNIQPLEAMINEVYQRIMLLQQETMEMVQENKNVSTTWLTESVDNELQFIINSFGIVLPLATDLQQELKFTELTTLTSIRNRLLNIQRTLADCLKKVKVLTSSENKFDLLPEANAGLISIPSALVSTRDELISLKNDFMITERGGMHVNATEIANDLTDMEYIITSTLKNVKVITQKLITEPNLQIQLSNLERKSINSMQKDLQPIFIITQDLEIDVQLEYARIEVMALKDLVMNANVIRRKLSEVLNWLPDAKAKKKSSANMQEITAKFKFIGQELETMQRNIKIASMAGMKTKLGWLLTELVDLKEAVTKTNLLLNKLAIDAKQTKSNNLIQDLQSAITIIQSSFNQIYGIESHANLELRKRQLMAADNITQEITLALNEMKIVLRDIAALQSTITTIGLHSTPSELKSMKIIHQRLKKMQHNLARIFVNLFISDFPENIYIMESFKMIKSAANEAVYLAKTLFYKSTFSAYDHRYDLKLAADIKYLYTILQPISSLMSILQRKIDIGKQYIYTITMLDIKRQIDNLNVTFNNTKTQFKILGMWQYFNQPNNGAKIHLQAAALGLQKGVELSVTPMMPSYLFYIKEGVDSLECIMTYLVPYLEIVSETNLYVQIPQMKQSILEFQDVVKLLRKSISEVVQDTEYTINIRNQNEILKVQQNMKNAFHAVKDGTDLMYQLEYDAEQELKEIYVMTVLQLQQYINDIQILLRQSLMDLDRAKHKVEERDFQYIDVKWEDGLMKIGGLQYKEDSLEAVQLLTETIEIALEDSNRLIQYARSQVALVVILELNFDTTRLLTYLSIMEEIIEELILRVKLLMKEITTAAHGVRLNKAMFVENTRFISEQIEYILNNIRPLTDDTFNYLMYVKHDVGRSIKRDLTDIQQATNQTITIIKNLEKLTSVERNSLFNATQALFIEFSMETEIRKREKMLLEMRENLNIAKLADKELNTTKFIEDFEELEDTRKTVAFVLEYLIGETKIATKIPDSLNLAEIQVFLQNITELLVIEVDEFTDLVSDTLFMFWGIQFKGSKIKDDFESILSVLRSSLCNKDDSLFQGDMLTIPGKPINISDLRKDLGNVLSAFKNSIPFDRTPKSIHELKAQLTDILKLTEDTVGKQMDQTHIPINMRLPKGTNMQLLHENLGAFFKSLSDIAGVVILDNNIVESGGAKINLTNMKENLDNFLRYTLCDGKCNTDDFVNKKNIADIQSNTNVIFKIIDENPQRVSNNLESQRTESDLANAINVSTIQNNINSILKFFENGFSSTGNGRANQDIQQINVAQTKYDLQQIFKALNDTMLSDNTTTSIPLEMINENLSASDLQTIQNKMDFLLALSGNLEQDHKFDINKTLPLPPGQMVNLTDVKRGMEYILDFIEQASFASDVAGFLSMASAINKVQNSFDIIFNLLDTKVCPALNNSVTARQFLSITKPNVDVTDFKLLLDKIFAFVKNKLKEESAISFQNNLGEGNMSMLIELLNSEEGIPFPVINGTHLLHPNAKVNQDLTELKTYLPGTWHFFAHHLSDGKNDALINDIEQSITDMDVSHVKSQLDNLFLALGRTNAPSGYTATLLPDSQVNLPRVKSSSHGKTTVLTKNNKGINQSAAPKEITSVVQNVVRGAMKSVFVKKA